MINKKEYTGNLMQLKSNLRTLCAKALSESIDVRTMRKFIDPFIPNYNVYERTGYPENFPIQKIDAAKQIVADILQENLFLEFVCLLIKVHTEGFMGRKYHINHLREIVKEVNEFGLIYDKKNKMFIEDPYVRRTRNWGTLREGEDYIFSFLKIDIVNNSKMVRKYSDKKIQSTFSDIRKIVQRSIDKRNGRIWKWEGDGGLVAFYFSDKNIFATLSGIEIIHDLFLYNSIDCKLDKPVEVRMAIHGGLCEYTNNDENQEKNEVIKRLADIEAKHTEANSLTITSVIKPSFDTRLSNIFKPAGTCHNLELFNYKLRWEE